MNLCGGTDIYDIDNVWKKAHNPCNMMPPPPPSAVCCAVSHCIICINTRGLKCHDQGADSNFVTGKLMESFIISYIIYPSP